MGNIIVHSFVEQDVRHLVKNETAQCENCAFAEEAQLIDGSEGYVCNARLYDVETLACFVPKHHNECRNCENCDLMANKCFNDGAKCYENGVCLHPGCNKFEMGTWECK